MAFHPDPETFHATKKPHGKQKLWRISDQLRDLCSHDISVAYDCAQWLSPKQRDIDRRVRPKRLTTRYLAACMIVKASENPAFAKEVLDRTEGKVADRLDVSARKKVEIRIELADVNGSTRQLTPPDIVVEKNEPLQLVEKIGSGHNGCYQTCASPDAQTPADSARTLINPPEPAPAADLEAPTPHPPMHAIDVIRLNLDADPPPPETSASSIGPGVQRSSPAPVSLRRDLEG